MKSILLVLPALVFTVSTFAAEVKPLITKSSGGGHVHPNWAGFERCDVFPTRVVITHQMGMQAPNAVKLVERRTISLGGDLLGIIDRLSTEKVAQKPNHLCDGPSTGIYANPAQGEPVLLFSTGGCGSPRQLREGVLSDRLRNIVNMYCPKTYDFSDPKE